jgi:nitric oxide reductase large subunit
MAGPRRNRKHCLVDDMNNRVIQTINILLMYIVILFYFGFIALIPSIVYTLNTAQIISPHIHFVLGVAFGLCLMNVLFLCLRTAKSLKS